jgi:DNA-binding CsgD family transcriptional regulator
MKNQTLAVAKKLWEYYSPKEGAHHTKTVSAHEIADRLAHFFMPGNFYYYIFNISAAEFEYISPDIESVLGYHPQEITTDFFFNKIHPEDQVYYVNSEKMTGDFLISLPKGKPLKYKIRLPLRIQKKDGSYAQLLHQTMIIELDDDGHLLRTLGVHSDIGFLHPIDKPVYSIIGFDGEPSFIDLKVKNELIPVKEILSKREKEILTLIMNGMQNKEIASHLHISKETVDKHRKNMLKKCNCKNSNELIGRAMKNGWM